MKDKVLIKDLTQYINRRFALLVVEREVLPDKIAEEKKRYPANKQIEGRIKELRKLRKWVNVYVNSGDATET